MKDFFKTPLVFVAVLFAANAIAAPTVKSFAKTVASAGTAVALSATKIDTPFFCIKADGGNTNNIYVGDSTVAAASGYELVPGEEICFTYSYKDKFYNLAKAYVDADTNGNKALVLYVEK